jgi:NAD(P)-dependent dehydrogenase (short-subunit alcohol dehydrogenase family)
MAGPHAGKVAVVTGGASGIGQACAVRLAEDGADVAIADVQPAAETARRIEAAGRQALALACDITDPAKVTDFAKAVEERLGRCDILVNNAGMYAFSAFEELSFEDWRRYFALNVDGAFLAAKAFIPGMKARGWGRIVNMASNSYSLYVQGLTHYVATKGALIGLTRGLASDFGDHGITVNAVAPGPTITDKLRTSFFEMTPGADEAALRGFLGAISANQAIKRAGSPDDVAGVVSFLASDAARFVTAQTIVIDGGGARL